MRAFRGGRFGRSSTQAWACSRQEPISHARRRRRRGLLLRFSTSLRFRLHGRMRPDCRASGVSRRSGRRIAAVGTILPNPRRRSFVQSSPRLGAPKRKRVIAPTFWNEHRDEWPALDVNLEMKAGSVVRVTSDSEASMVPPVLRTSARLNAVVSANPGCRLTLEIMGDRLNRGVSVQVIVAVPGGGGRVQSEWYVREGELVHPTNS